MIEILHWPPCKILVILVGFEWNLNFPDISENKQISNFMKIRPVRDQLFHANRETDMTNLIVAFRNFAKASRNISNVKFHVNTYI